MAVTYNSQIKMKPEPTDELHIIRKKELDELAENTIQKEVGNAKDIKFDDGETFQEKYESGELKGKDGAKGDKGDKGDTGAKGADAVLKIKATSDFTTSELPNGAWGGVY